MVIEEALEVIQMRLKELPAMDTSRAVGVCPGTVYRWRKTMPRRPTLEVFVRFAVYCDLNIHIKELRKLA